MSEQHREAKVTVTSPLTIAYNDAPDAPIEVDRLSASVPVLSVDDDVLVETIGSRLHVVHKVTVA